MDLPEKDRIVLEKMPSWLKLAVPPNAVRDDALIAEALSLVNQPEQLQRILSNASSTNSYPHLINMVNAHVWPIWPTWAKDLPFGLLEYARHHFPRRARLRVLRHLAKHPVLSVRNRVRSQLSSLQAAEVTLPQTAEGDWNTDGWFSGIHSQGESFQVRKSPTLQTLLPKISTVGDLRELLEIKSSSQLGWMLLATDGEKSPYQKFEIPKRNGQPLSLIHI